MRDKIYWFITVFEYIEEDDLGWPKFGATRCWGFYTDKEVALKALHELLHHHLQMGLQEIHLHLISYMYLCTE